ncbi:MAG: hypothetical protein OHK0046_17050 [Anaerolineae bacterium]
MTPSNRIPRWVAILAAGILLIVVVGLTLLAALSLGGDNTSAPAESLPPAEALPGTILTADAVDLTATTSPTRTSAAPSGGTMLPSTVQSTVMVNPGDDPPAPQITETMAPTEDGGAGESPDDEAETVNAVQATATALAQAFLNMTLTPGTPRPTSAGSTGGTGGQLPDTAGGGGGNAIEYTVQPGDTLASIAQRFGLTVDDLLNFNNDAEIAPGDTVFIPLLALTEVAEASTAVPFQPQATADDTLGRASAYVFHEDDVRSDETTLVELQLFFDAVFITATPTSPVTEIPVTQDIPRPVVGGAESTPPPADFSESDITLPEWVIARLDCGDRFDGCGEKPMRRLEISLLNRWVWALTPREGVRGSQPVILELWSVNEDDQRGSLLWQNQTPVAIIVRTASENQTSALPVVLAVGVLGTAAAGGAWVWFTRRKVPRTRPTAFISYRRSVSWGIARALNDSLTQRGADVFIDIDDIHEGSFGEYIQQNIENRDYFIVVLAPGTLQSEWVRKEIHHALEHKRTIIPVLVDGFDLYGDELPDDLKVLQSQNAVIITPEYVTAGFDRVAQFIGLTPRP